MRTFYEGILGSRERGSPCVCVDARPRPRGCEGMFASIMGLGLDTRHPRGHVPACPDRYLPGVESITASKTVYL